MTERKQMELVACRAEIPGRVPWKKQKSHVLRLPSVTRCGLVLEWHPGAIVANDPSTATCVRCSGSAPKKDGRRYRKTNEIFNAVERVRWDDPDGTDIEAGAANSTLDALLHELGMEE